MTLLFVLSRFIFISVMQICTITQLLQFFQILLILVFALFNCSAAARAGPVAGSVTKKKKKKKRTTHAHIVVLVFGLHRNADKQHLAGGARLVFPRKPL